MGQPESWRVSDAPQGTPTRVRSSARYPLHGVRLAPGVDPNDPLVPSDIAIVDGVPVTSGERTAFDLLRTASRLKYAVSRGDACLRYGLTTRDVLQAYVAEHRGWRGVELARQAVPLLDGRSRSGKSATSSGSLWRASICLARGPASSASTWVPCIGWEPALGWTSRAIAASMGWVSRWPSLSPN